MVKNTYIIQITRLPPKEQRPRRSRQRKIIAFTDAPGEALPEFENTKVRFTRSIFKNLIETAIGDSCQEEADGGNDDNSVGTIPSHGNFITKNSQDDNEGGYHHRCKRNKAMCEHR